MSTYTFVRGNNGTLIRYLDTLRDGIATDSELQLLEKLEGTRVDLNKVVEENAGLMKQLAAKGDEISHYRNSIKVLMRKVDENQEQERRATQIMRFELAKHVLPAVILHEGPSIPEADATCETLRYTDSLLAEIGFEVKS